MWPRISGESWFAVEVTARPVPSWTSHDQPRSAGWPWSSGAMDSQNKLWSRCPTPLLRTSVRLSPGRASRVADQLIDGTVCPRGPIECGVEAGDVAAVVLVVVQTHRQLVDRGLRRAVRIRERWQCERHGNECHPTRARLVSGRPTASHQSWASVLHGAGRVTA